FLQERRSSPRVLPNSGASSSERERRNNGLADFHFVAFPVVGASACSHACRLRTFGDSKSAARRISGIRAASDRDSNGSARPFDDRGRGVDLFADRKLSEWRDWFEDASFEECVGIVIRRSDPRYGRGSSANPPARSGAAF